MAKTKITVTGVVSMSAVNNHDTNTRFLSIRNVCIYKMTSKVTLLFTLSIFLGTCSKESDNAEELVFSEKKVLGVYQGKVTFDEVFEFTEKRSLQFPNDVYHAFNIAANMVFTDDYIISIDQMQSRLHLFKRSGDYISAFGREGEGPGEYSFIQFWGYKDGILYIYDGGLKKISLVKIPDLSIEKEFSIDLRISDFIIAADKIVAITPSTPEGGGIVSLIDPSSESVLHRTHVPEDLSATIYLARSSTGDMTSIDENSLLVLYPDKDYLFEYKVDENNLSAVTNFTFNNINNDFRPRLHPFPRHLNPYGSSEEHSKWYESSSHLFQINFLKPNLISIAGSRYIEQDSSQYFFNVYTINGDVIAEGINLPSDTLARPQTAFGEYLIFPLAENSTSNKLEYYLANIRNEFFEL
jgi:hypothetical protein